MDYIIIGTDHKLQKSDATKTGLRDMLLSIVNKREVVLIAEEVSTSKDISTFGRELIGDAKWLSIDMTTQERKDAGIYEVLRAAVGPGYDPVTHRDIRVNPYHMRAETVRENFWLDRIAKWCEDNQVSAGTIVITCGHNHLKFLSDKVIQRGHNVTTREYVPYDIEAEHGVFQIYP